MNTNKFIFDFDFDFTYDFDLESTDTKDPVPDIWIDGNVWQERCHIEDYFKENPNEKFVMLYCGCRKCTHFC